MDCGASLAMTKRVFAHRLSQNSLKRRRELARYSDPTQFENFRLGIIRVAVRERDIR